MEITDEIFAKYAEGKATPEEVTCVRKYLIQHPEERENLLLLMDDHQDYLGEWKENEFENTKDADFSDIMMSAAAFAPTRKAVKQKKRSSVKDSGSFLSRMSNMLDELDQID
jgi:hypothetical protein